LPGHGASGASGLAGPVRCSESLARVGLSARNRSISCHASWRVSCQLPKPKVDWSQLSESAYRSGATQTGHNAPGLGKPQLNQFVSSAFHLFRNVAPSANGFVDSAIKEALSVCPFTHANAARGVSENSGTGVRNQSERLSENPRNRQLTKILWPAN
jgi:hypothetical protein